MMVADTMATKAATNEVMNSALESKGNMRDQQSRAVTAEPPNVQPARRRVRSFRNQPTRGLDTNGASLPFLVAAFSSLLFLLAFLFFFPTPLFLLPETIGLDRR